jgi:transposase InsO family protein
MPNTAKLTQEQAAELMERSRRSVRRRADELQPVEGEIARNGKPAPVYDVALLPAEAQRRWAATLHRKVVELVPAAVDAGQLTLALTAPEGPNLSAKDRAKAERRYDAIAPVVDAEKYPALHAQYPRQSALYAFLAGQATAAEKHKVSVRTIRRWIERWRMGGLPGLVRKDRADKGGSKVMTASARALLLKLSLPQKGVYGILRVADMWRVYEEERVWRDAHVTRPMGEFERDKYAEYIDTEGRLAPAAQLPAVAYRTFCTWFQRIPEMIRTLGREGEDAYRDSQEILSHRDYLSLEPMEYVVMDHRVLDLFCMVRDGRAGWKLARPWLTAAIDMRTRKWLGWAIVETPSSDSIAVVLKKVFLNFGLPKELYWDNGKDFRCEWFEGKARKARQAERIADLDPTWCGVLGTLGIRVRHAIPYNARAKLIEANFNRVSNVDRTLPEWCGHKPGARPEHYPELVKRHEAFAAGTAETTPFRTIEEIGRLYDAVLRDLNERPVEGEGMRKVTPLGHGWKCPNEAWEDQIGRVERRSVPADVLHMCFAKRKQITVQHGELRTTHDGQPYFYRMSDGTQRLNLLNGKVVDYAYDPLDMGEGAVYYEDRFFGLVHCVQLRHMGEQGFVEDERARRAARREVRKAILAAVAAAPGISLEERLNRRADVLPDRPGAARVEIPVELPAGVEAAAAADRKEKSFDFRAPADAVNATEAAAPQVDEEFQFFGKS